MCALHTFRSAIRCIHHEEQTTVNSMPPTSPPGKVLMKFMKTITSQNAQPHAAFGTVRFASLSPHSNSSFGASRHSGALRAHSTPLFYADVLERKDRMARLVRSFFIFTVFALSLFVVFFIFKRMRRFFKPRHWLLSSTSHLLVELLSQRAVEDLAVHYCHTEAPARIDVQAMRIC